MLPRSRKIDLALDLNNSQVCVQEGTTTLLNLADYFRANKMKYMEMKFPKLEEAIKAYESEGVTPLLLTSPSFMHSG